MDQDNSAKRRIQAKVEIHHKKNLFTSKNISLVFLVAKNLHVSSKCKQNVNYLLQKKKR